MIDEILNRPMTVNTISFILATDKNELPDIRQRVRKELMKLKRNGKVVSSSVITENGIVTVWKKKKPSRITFHYEL